MFTRYLNCSQGFVAQTLKMDPIEKARRWKRSLDGYITFRKAVLLALFVFVLILYVGPSIFSWMFQSKSTRIYGETKKCFIYFRYIFVYMLMNLY